MSVVERERVEEVVAPKVTEADVLERAADLLEEFGWCQHVPARDEIGNSLRSGVDRNAMSFCLTGAIERSIHDLTGHDWRIMGTAVIQSLTGWRFRRLFDAEAMRGNSGPDWNNDPKRTKAEVVAVLRTAAQKARES